MAIGIEEAVAVILDAAPEFRPTYEAHLDVYGELIPHLFMAELAQFTSEAARGGDERLVDGVLAAVSHVFVEADDEVDNAVALSFVELLGNEHGTVVARFPPPLVEELRRQQRGRAPGRVRRLLTSWRQSLIR